MRSLLLVVPLSVMIAPAWSADLTRTDGVVKSSRDRQPIPGARVTAECRKESFHGSRVLTTIETYAGADGHFDFDKHQLEPCDFMFVRAEKDGWVMASSVDIRYGFTAYKEIPREVFLTPVASKRLQQLEYEYAMSTGKSLTPNPTGDYRRVFTAFHCSRLIAEAVEETRYVREHYCERLKNLEAEMGSEARQQLPSLPPEQCGGGVLRRAERANVDPDEVHAFCESS